MEGVASEAASLAGHLQLGKLIYLYDDNHISIEGSTDIAFTEDRGKRFEAYGWHVQHVADGLDVEAIDAAIEAAKQDPRPSHHRGAQHHRLRHADPPGDGEGARRAAGRRRAERRPRRTWAGRWSRASTCPTRRWRSSARRVERGAAQEQAWHEKFEAYWAAYPELAAELERRLAGELPEGWAEGLLEFPADPKGIAHARVLGQGAQRHCRAAARPGRRLGRPGALDHDLDEQQRGLRRRLPRRAQHPLRRARARHGRDRQRHGLPRRDHPLRRDLPRLLRLHAPGAARGGAVAPAARSRSSRTTASAWAKTAPPTSRSSTWPRCGRSPT